MNIDIPQLHVITEEKTNETYDTYTQFELTGIDKYSPEVDDIFNQSQYVIEYLIRTRTVIGYLKKVFGENQPEIDVDFIYIDDNGVSSSKQILLGYLLPHEFFGNNSIDFVKFKETAAALDDRQKATKLKGKVLYKIGSVNKYARKINYYCFLASRTKWKEISDQNSLYYGNDKEYGMIFRDGIYVATKGMPTGIVVEPPTTGSSGYWHNLIMIIEDDKIVFDLGRKTIPSRTKSTIKEIAHDLFNEFLPFMGYIKDDTETITLNSAVQQMAKNNSYNSFLNYADLGVDKIGYLKNPNEQEAAVSAIFHELIGAGLLKGYHSLSTGYKQTYDLWTKYDISSDLVGDNMKQFAIDGRINLPCVIEFKYMAESIISDLSEDIKFFTDMDLIVCWDINEQVFAKYQISVEKMDKKDVLFYGSNYKLTWPGSYNLGSANQKPVLCLRQFIDGLQ